MSTAKEYLKQQIKKPEFKQSFLNEKARLDIEYQLEELKRDITVCKPVNELIGKIDQMVNGFPKWCKGTDSAVRSACFFRGQNFWCVANSLIVAHVSR